MNLHIKSLHSPRIQVLMNMPYINYNILNILFQLPKCRKFELILVQFTIKTVKNILIVKNSVNQFNL